MTNLPRIPTLFSFPLKFIPKKIHSSALVTVLNQALQESLQAGELDFLKQKILAIRVTDLNIEFYITLIGDRLVARNQNLSDVLIEGTTYDFLQLATRKEDPDTLFFNRRLRISGNTNLGLYVKNWLDSLEPEELFGTFFKHLEHTTYLFEQVNKIQQSIIRFKPNFK
ncbi:MAG: SCP2 sterol-binding domain-containing protein [Thiomargarita sp.]|nr:SCP2 sterol-binding domain-containing protein [Thiomargarita sp.]